MSFPEIWSRCLVPLSVANMGYAVAMDKLLLDLNCWDLCTKRAPRLKENIHAFDYCLCT